MTRSPWRGSPQYPKRGVHEELGELLLAAGDAASARSHLARAYALLSQDSWLVEQEPERLRRLAELGAEPYRTAQAAPADPTPAVLPLVCCGSR